MNEKDKSPLRRSLGLFRNEVEKEIQIWGFNQEAWTCISREEIKKKKKKERKNGRWILTFFFFFFFLFFLILFVCHFNL